MDPTTGAAPRASAPADPGDAVLPSVERAMRALDGVPTVVAHRVVLDHAGRELATGRAPCPADLVAAFRGMLAVVAQSGTLGRNSARVVLDTQDVCLLLYRLGPDLAVALVLDPGQNLALVRRLTEPVLTAFVEDYLAESAERAAAGPVPAAPAEPPPAPGSPGPLPVRGRRAVLASARHEEAADRALLDRLLDGLSVLS